MDKRTREILTMLAAGGLPKRIPNDCDYAAELRALNGYLEAVGKFVADLAKGNISASPAVSGGPLIGNLKMLNANLRHLACQAKQIAHGDLSLRVDFPGEFSDAFNIMVEEFARTRDELLHISTRDPLTGMYNRAYFDTEIDRIAQGRNFPVTILIADVDNLKMLNDNKGHAAGDRLLVAAATILRKSSRGDDIVARIGGDEFAVIMPNTGEETAAAVLDRIRAIQAIHNATAGGIAVSISVGAGTAATRDNLASAIKLADKRMYQTKALNKS